MKLKNVRSNRTCEIISFNTMTVFKEIQNGKA